MSSTNSEKLYSHFNSKVNSSNNNMINNKRRVPSDLINKNSREFPHQKRIVLKNFPVSNGIPTYNSDKPDTSEAFINSTTEGFPHKSIQNSILLSNCKDSLSSNDLSLNSNSLPNATRNINTEPEMPSLIREIDTDQRNSSLTGSSKFNQRYQNVRQFPNYRHRKKGAFEKKLRRCGLELDEEVTISILRQFLQPFIYRDINTILDDYIKKYFLKAFENIRENINITSENWSQILKCSISKSLYKQYCVNATIDPFNPQSANLSDFPCFPTVCKTSNLSNHKPTGIPNDDTVQISNINCDTIPDIISETFSETSTYSENDEHFEMTNQIENVTLQQHCTNRPNFNFYSHSESDKNKKASIYLFGKHHIETTEIKNSSNHRDSLDGFSNSIHRPHSDVTRLNQQTNHCHYHGLSRKTVEVPLSNYSQFHTHNNLQNVENGLSEMDHETTQPNTAPFDNKNISFFQTPKLSSISSNSSLSAMQPDYLNSSHRSFKLSETNNHYFQKT